MIRRSAASAGKTQVFVFPGGPSANANDPRARGRPGRAVGRRRAQPQCATRRSDGYRSRLRSRAGRTCQRRCLVPLPRWRVRSRPVGRRRHTAAAQSLRRDPRRYSQSLVELAGSADSRRRGGVMGRPDRLRLPRLRRRGCRWNRDRENAAIDRCRAMWPRSLNSAGHICPGDGDGDHEHPVESA